MRPGNPTLRKLMQEARPGYSFRPTGRSKAALVGPDGELIRHPDGRPVTFPCSCTHAEEGRLRRRLVALGVIEGRRRT